ncbi:hypothetical protein AcW1_004162 [Taiwanofungus camphoratus]|nr:hypothetical protein AcW1_004162 [Antrodia cinnamomea]
MPLIRKKTSNRGTTNQREKIKHKVAETRKKRKKETKRNPQWKTKHPKDPGIPNNFPYKDQILAEVAEQRRQATEEKERRREGKKAAKAQAAGEDGFDGAESGETGFDGVRAINAGMQEKTSSQANAMEVYVEDNEEAAPMLVNRDLPNLKSVLDLADVVVEVLDARDPLRYRSSHIEALSEGKKTLIILNKIDGCPREAVTSWATTLRSQRPTLLFRAASAFLPSAPESSNKGKGKERADDSWGTDSVLSCLRLWAQEKEGSEPLVAAIVGVTNAGKSSFVNSLTRKAVLPIYKFSSHMQDGPSTTSYPQEVELEIDGKQVRIIDTPGLSWHSPSDLSDEGRERLRAQDILLRNRGRIERLKDPGPVVAELASRADREDLMLLYNLPAFAEGNPNAFLSGVARSNGLIKKGGALDLAGASRIVLRDWSTGKFPRYTMPASPPSPSTTLSDPSLADVYAKDGQILSNLLTRKEMRKAGGVVKLKPGEKETRKVLLDAAWIGSEDEDGNESDVEKDESGDDTSEDIKGSDEDDEDEEHEGDEDEDEKTLPLTGKCKRAATKAAIPLPRPAKKVAFSAEPRGTKQARAAAGVKGQQMAALNTNARSTVEGKFRVKPQSKAAKTTRMARDKPSAETSTVATTKNANPSSKKTSASKGNDGEEAYDFNKFF